MREQNFEDWEAERIEEEIELHNQEQEDGKRIIKNINNPVQTMIRN